MKKILGNGRGRTESMLVFVDESGDSGFKTSDPILYGNAGDKRHSSGRKQFQYYIGTNIMALSSKNF